MIKHILLSTVALTFSHMVIAEPQFITNVSELAGAESVVYDAQRQVYFVSLQAGNKNEDGSVVVLNKNKKFIATVASGLQDPKGIAVKGDLLYVGDMRHLVEVDLRSGAIKKYQPKGAEFLNDVAIDKSGDIYVSDMFTSTIYKFSDGEISSWMSSSKLENPNGMLFVGDVLYIAAWGSFSDGNPLKAPYGNLLKVDVATQQISSLTKQPLGNLDGIQLDKNGDFILSDWKRGLIFSVSSKGDSKVVIDVAQGAGDIHYNIDEQTLLIPMALDGELLEYRF